MSELKPYLIKLVEKQSLTRSDIEAILSILVSKRATEAQVGSLLTLLKVNGLDQDPELVSNFVTSLLTHSDLVHFDNLKLSEEIVDIVGTGGDSWNTFNVSTASAIVVAGCGVKVAKHGNRSSTSNSGSSDFLQALSLDIEKVNCFNVERILSQSNFCFLFASTFHKSWGPISSIRKQLGFPTLFNFLGPLLNPTKPKSMVVGVNKRELGRLMVESLQLLGVQRALVVNGMEGLDEVSIAGDTQVWELKQGKILEYVINPTHFNLPTHPLNLVQGSSASSNAEIFQKIVTLEVKEHPILDFILLNSAALLVVSNKVDDFAKGVQLARQAILNGEALHQLNLARTVLNQI